MARRSLKARFPIILIALFLAVPLAAYGTEPLTPNPALAPAQVVAIQLKALQRNDSPIPDAGIMQTWAFAHPDNRRMTGPLPRFAAMIRAPGYRMLINHRRHDIKLLGQSNSQADFAVTVTGADGRAVLFHWQLAKVHTGDMTGAWMTTAVSLPFGAGEET